MSARWWCLAAALAAAWCALGGAAPAADLAARRRSATDRTFIRFGRSPYAVLPAGDSEDPEDRHSRYTRARQDNIIRLGRSDSYLRFGRSPTLRLTREDLLDLLRPSDYPTEIHPAKRRANNFVRLGRRDTNFLRLGRSAEEYPGFEVNGELTIIHRQPERKKDSHLRLGRSGNGEISDGFSDGTDEEQDDSRSKRSLEACTDCVE